MSGRIALARSHPHPDVVVVHRADDVGGRGEFDLAIVTDVCCALDAVEIESLFSALSRVLRPGGHLAIVEEVATEISNEPHHFSFSRYLLWLRSAGFVRVSTTGRSIIVAQRAP